MLTARDACEDNDKGCVTGVGDYLTKPFDLRELTLRCVALARRPNLHSEIALENGRLKIDARNQLVTWAGTLIKLINTDFKNSEFVNYALPISRNTQ